MSNLDTLIMLVGMCHADILQAWDATFQRTDRDRIREDMDAAQAGYDLIQLHALGDDARLKSVPYPTQRNAFVIWCAENSPDPAVRSAWEAFRDAVHDGTEAMPEYEPTEDRLRQALVYHWRMMPRYENDTDGDCRLMRYPAGQIVLMTSEP